MQTNRRNWLKKIGLGVGGIGLSQLDVIASPISEQFYEAPLDLPIRLSSNENPYGPSPLARKAMMDSFGMSNRYGQDLMNQLMVAIAKKNGVAVENILVTAGSTEILDLVPRLAALNKGTLIVPDPSFTYFTSAAEKSGLKVISVPLTIEKKIDLPAMLKAIQPDTKLVYICNPNNPTGTVSERGALVEFINEASKNAKVLVDEAYIDFTLQQSLSNLIVENKNLVIAKTFSKIYGLAGARIGYAIAHPEMIAKITNLVSWPNGAVSVASTAAALASLGDEKFTTETFSMNEAARSFTIAELERLGLRCIPSQTNFIYFTLENYKKDFFQQLEKNKIEGTRIYEEKGKWTRITVGRMEEMKRFIAAIS